MVADISAVQKGSGMDSTTETGIPWAWVAGAIAAVAAGVVTAIRWLASKMNDAMDGRIKDLQERATWSEKQHEECLRDRDRLRERIDALERNIHAK